MKVWSFPKSFTSKVDERFCLRVFIKAGELETNFMSSTTTTRMMNSDPDLRKNMRLSTLETLNPQLSNVLQSRDPQISPAWRNPYKDLRRRQTFPGCSICPEESAASLQWVYPACHIDMRC